jgi:hypothetical protein
MKYGVRVLIENHMEHTNTLRGRLQESFNALKLGYLQKPSGSGGLKKYGVRVLIWTHQAADKVLLQDVVNTIMKLWIL